MYYFASDLHLGLASMAATHDRERLFVKWLEEVSTDAKAIFLVGDIFDFWFEYKRVIPKGYTRILGKLSELSDRGVEIHLFTGNHDMWCLDYFERECGVKIHYGPYITTLYGKKVYIDHGNMIPRGGFWHWFMNFMFTSKVVRGFFRGLLHPNFTMWFGQKWSLSSRQSKSVSSEFRSEGEPIVDFARNMLTKEPMDYFIFGHLHCRANYPLSESCRLIMLGEWVEGTTYAKMDPSGEITLLNY